MARYIEGYKRGRKLTSIPNLDRSKSVSGTADERLESGRQVIRTAFQDTSTISAQVRKLARAGEAQQDLFDELLVIPNALSIIARQDPFLLPDEERLVCCKLALGKNDQNLLAGVQDILLVLVYVPGPERKLAPEIEPLAYYLASLLRYERAFQDSYSEDTANGFAMAIREQRPGLTDAIISRMSEVADLFPRPKVATQALPPANRQTLPARQEITSARPNGAHREAPLDAVEVCATACRAAKRESFDAALRYLGEYIQPGKPLAAHQDSLVAYAQLLLESGKADEARRFIEDREDILTKYSPAYQCYALCWEALDGKRSAIAYINEMIEPGGPMAGNYSLRRFKARLILDEPQPF